jgi:hypothetical protein
MKWKASYLNIASNEKLLVAMLAHPTPWKLVLQHQRQTIGKHS